MAAATASVRNRSVTAGTFAADLAGKRLELLKEVVPRLAGVAVLWDAGGPSKLIEFRGTSTAASALGVELQSLEGKRRIPIWMGHSKRPAEDALRVWSCYITR